MIISSFKIIVRLLELQFIPISLNFLGILSLITVLLMKQVRSRNQVMLLARRVLLVGDSKQLPPLVQSDINNEDGLSVSLLTRLENRSTSDAFSVHLTIQYRMNEAVMGLSNHLIYDDCMKAGNDTVRNEECSNE